MDKKEKLLSIIEFVKLNDKIKQDIEIILGDQVFTITGSLKGSFDKKLKEDEELLFKYTPPLDPNME